MNNWKLYQWMLLAIGVVGALVLVITGVKLDRMAHVLAGYKAKVTCSEVFLAGRDAQMIIENEFVGIDPAMDKISVHPDLDNRQVSASAMLGLGRARAIYREGYGCTLANAGRLSPLPAATPALAVDPWPIATADSGDAIDRVNYGAMDAALTRAFNENNANHRAVLVVVDGKIVGERYADGFNKDTPFLSWSAGKSVMATLIGAAVLNEVINIHDTAPVASWKSDSVRATITWNDLLQMQSGLDFSETYSDVRSDVNRMLFEAADVGAIPEKSSSAYAPGTHWYYSSGTTNLLSKLLRQELTKNGFDYYSFAQQEIFDPIGAASFTLEPDASGTFISSSFVYATARDWARLGQLYLQDGVWNGKRLLPEGWAHYVATPAAASNGQYGAHFWLNYDGDDRPRDFPGVPEEMYYMAGHEGQYVIIIPSKRMVIVRTGMTRGTSPRAAVAPLIKDLYDAVGD